MDDPGGYPPPACPWSCGHACAPTARPCPTLGRGERASGPQTGRRTVAPTSTEGQARLAENGAAYEGGSEGATSGRTAGRAVAAATGSPSAGATAAPSKHPNPYAAEVPDRACGRGSNLGPRRGQNPEAVAVRQGAGTSDEDARRHRCDDGRASAACAPAFPPDVSRNTVVIYRRPAGVTEAVAPLVTAGNVGVAICIDSARAVHGTTAPAGVIQGGPSAVDGGRRRPGASTTRTGKGKGSTPAGMLAAPIDVDGPLGEAVDKGPGRAALVGTGSIISHPAILPATAEVDPKPGYGAGDRRKDDRPGRGQRYAGLLQVDVESNRQGSDGE